MFYLFLKKITINLLFFFITELQPKEATKATKKKRKKRKMRAYWTIKFSICPTKAPSLNPKSNKI